MVFQVNFREVFKVFKDIVRYLKTFKDILRHLRIFEGI